MTIQEYSHKAFELLNSVVDENIEGFVSKDGWAFRYNKLLNEFATAKPDGTIETFFRPKNGIEYWKRQLEIYGSK